MSSIYGFFRWSLVALLLGAFCVTAMVATAVGLIAPQVPSTQSLASVEFTVPLRVYARDGRLLAEFGEQRREPVQLDGVPEQMVQAFLAAEDERFFTHPGVDWQGLTRAAIALLRTGERAQGGSTITMQVARNFFLSSEKTYLRKIIEILLSLRIERELSKKEIFELYLNKIFLGHRSYGVAAAARTYYDKSLHELNLAQVAMIAGLPKAPSRFNPVVNPKRAVTRRNYVIRRMRQLGFVDAEAAEAALAAPVTAKVHGSRTEVEAPYVAEMVRAQVEAAYGPQAYSLGLKVHTTIDASQQGFANAALRRGLDAYDVRHGYRGAEGRVRAAQLADPAAALEGIARYGDLLPAVVTRVTESEVEVHAARQGALVIDKRGWGWARPHIDEDRVGAAPKKAFDVVDTGDLVRVLYVDPRENSDSKKSKKEAAEPYWRLAQVPAVSGAFVALDPSNGALRALVGGYDFGLSKFNRAIQSQRQPGSAFKPFLYAAALDRGLTASTVINDAPIVWEDEKLEEFWRPKNYSGKFYGPTRLRVALYNSRNLVSIRLIRNVGIDFVADYAQRFGLPADQLPRNLSLSLGSGSASPLELARAYTPFAAGGRLANAYFIERIESASGELLHVAGKQRYDDACTADRLLALSPPVADVGAASEGELVPVKAVSVSSADPARDAALATFDADARARCITRAMPTDTAYIMNDIMRDVVNRGTATKAKALGRKDIGGKTGTTNDSRDAWFAGFAPQLVAVSWVGFDDYSPLGKGEAGGKAALPMWMDFMREALANEAERLPARPDTVVRANIDPRSGLLADGGGAVTELFKKGSLPQRARRSARSMTATSRAKEEDDSLF